MNLHLRARSIRTRITLWHIGVLVFTLGIYVLSTQMSLRHQLTSELEADLAEEADEIATLFLKPDADGNLMWRENHDDIENEYLIAVCHVNGFPIFQNFTGAGFILPPVSASSKDQGVTFHNLRMDDDTKLLIAQTIRTVSGIKVVIRVGRSISFFFQEMRHLLLVQVLCFPLVLLLAWAGGYFVAGRVLLPLQEIIARMKTLTAERLHEQLPIENPDDELGHLSITFNQLLGQLNHSFTQMRQFTGDASHELRTPLTAMRSVGEAALSAPLSVDEYKETVASMLEEVDRMSHLVSDLLSLARADSGAVKLDLNKVDLGEVIIEETARLEVLAEEKRQNLSLTVRCSCPVCLDRSNFRQAFANILFNAIQYSPELADIEILVARSENHCFVEIADSGPGIAFEHQPRIFDRFYRVDKVRSRENGGSGLGLAIARWAVEIHGGRIGLASRAGQGSTFRISLPVQEQEQCPATFARPESDSASPCPCHPEAAKHTRNSKPITSQPLQRGTTQAFSLWDRLAPWTPLVFAAIAFVCWGARSLWDTSEARYGQAAFEMMTTHNWLTPTLAGAPHLTKPPLSYWLIASGMELFGVNAWGARFFLSVSFLLTIFAVQSLGQAMGFEPRRARAAALVYATAAIPFAGGHTLTTDGFLVLWETLGVLAAWQVWQGAPQRQAMWRLIFWMAFGLAFLTKGPPGCLPLLIIPVFLGLRSGEPLPRLFSMAGFALFLIISLSWFGLMIWQKSDLLSYFLKDEVFKRIFTAGHHRNAPFWIYMPVLVIGMAPWLPLWPWIIKKAWHYRPGRNQRLNDWQLFLVLWFIIPLAIFTIAKSRLVFYVLPLFVPLSLGFGHVLVTNLLPRLAHCPEWRRAAKITAMIWLIPMIIYTNEMGFFSPDRSLRQAARVFNEAAANEAPASELYWIWAGRQQYSLAFSMQRIIKNTETIVPQTSLEKNSREPLYVTEEQALTKASSDGRLTPFGQPAILARAQGYVLFTVHPGAK